MANKKPQFVGRVNELHYLNSCWASDSFEFTVVYGRRRVGKTWLLRKYLEGKRAAYFMAVESDELVNLNGLSRAINSLTGAASDATYSSFEAALSDLAEIAREQPLVFVIDEFPYLAQSYPAISSIIQRLCDSEWAETQLHFILCGSSMSFMEQQVLGAKSPLYGRRTGQLKINPFTFAETESYLAGMSREDTAVLHAVTGGVAEYLSFVDPAASVEDNLVELLFTPYGRLSEEPMNLLKQELREPRRYAAILAAIAAGASKHNEIATRTGTQSGILTNYLTQLIDLRIVVREEPFGSKNSRRPVYRIADGLFRFWFLFVQPNQSMIEMFAGRAVFTSYVAPRLSKFMGAGFEQIAMDIFDSLNLRGELPALYQARGRWWGPNPSAKREEEIDLVASAGNDLLVAEFKWTTKPVDLSVLHTLEERATLVASSGNLTYMIISKSGFAPDLIREANNRADVLLIPFDQ